MTSIEGETISSLIAQKDVLPLEISVQRGLTEAAALNYRRMSACEVKIYPTVNVRELQKEIDRLSGQLRALDTKIQAANWNTDLL